MISEKFQSCITACNKCVAECEQSAIVCCRVKDVQLMDKCIELNLYCADMCRIASSFIARSHEHTMDFVNQFCNLCAEICEKCANECEKYMHIEQCRKCARVCRRCAEECREMSLEEVY